MPQLGPLDATLLDVLSNLVVGATVNVFREGAQVSGNQSGTSPLTVNVRHPGKIVAGDTAFVDNDNSTTYTVGAATATTVQLVGFSGTLSLLNNQRIVPSNNQPVIYSDDQGGASVAQPLTSDAFGGIAPPGGSSPLWMEGGAYEILAAAANAVARLYQSAVIVPEAPGVVYSGELDGISAVAHVEDTRFPFTTPGAKLKVGRNAGADKYAFDKDGTGIFARLGPTSTPTTGGALRIVDGNIFPLTVAGVQAALDECAAAGGGMVYVPAQANILISTTPVRLPNHVALWGIGAPSMVTPTFRADGNTNATSILENKSQDGTQQMFGLRNIHIDGGGKASGGTISKAALWCKLIYSSSYLKDVRVVNVPSKGILLEGTTTVTHGPFVLDNVVAANCNDDCFVINEGAYGIVVNFLEADRPGTGKAAVRIFHTPGAAAQSIGVRINSLYSEISGDATANFLVVDNAANVSLDSALLLPGGTPLTSPIIIKGTGASKGGPSGFTLRNVYFEDVANGGVLIDDQASGVQVKAGPNAGNAFRFVSWYSSPVAVGTIGNQTEGQIVGIQYQKYGPGLTAASTLAIPEGNYFLVAGNTPIDNISGFGTCDAGRVIILECSGTPTFKHNSGGTGNIRCLGSSDVVMTANDIIQFVSNGTLWKQCSLVVAI